MEPKSSPEKISSYFSHFDHKLFETITDPLVQSDDEDDVPPMGPAPSSPDRSFTESHPTLAPKAQHTPSTWIELIQAYMGGLGTENPELTEKLWRKFYEACQENYLEGYKHNPDIYTRSLTLKNLSLLLSTDEVPQDLITTLTHAEKENLVICTMAVRLAKAMESYKVNGDKLIFALQACILLPEGTRETVWNILVGPMLEKPGKRSLHSFSDYVHNVLAVHPFTFEELLTLIQTCALINLSHAHVKYSQIQHHKEVLWQLPVPCSIILPLPLSAPTRFVELFKEKIFNNENEHEIYRLIHLLAPLSPQQAEARTSHLKAAYEAVRPSVKSWYLASTGLLNKSDRFSVYMGYRLFFAERHLNARPCLFNINYLQQLPKALYFLKGPDVKSFLHLFRFYLAPAYLEFCPMKLEKDCKKATYIHNYLEALVAKPASDATKIPKKAAWRALYQLLKEERRNKEINVHGSIRHCIANNHPTFFDEIFADIQKIGNQLSLSEHALLARGLFELTTTIAYPLKHQKWETVLNYLFEVHQQERVKGDFFDFSSICAIMSLMGRNFVAQQERLLEIVAASYPEKKQQLAELFLLIAQKKLQDATPNIEALNEIISLHKKGESQQMWKNKRPDIPFAANLVRFAARIPHSEAAAAPNLFPFIHLLESHPETNPLAKEEFLQLQIQLLPFISDKSELSSMTARLCGNMKGVSTPAALSLISHQIKNTDQIPKISDILKLIDETTDEKSQEELYGIIASVITKISETKELKEAESFLLNKKISSFLDRTPIIKGHMLADRLLCQTRNESHLTPFAIQLYTHLLALPTESEYSTVWAKTVSTLSILHGRRIPVPSFICKKMKTKLEELTALFCSENPQWGAQISLMWFTANHYLSENLNRHLVEAWLEKMADLFAKGFNNIELTSIYWEMVKRGCISAQHAPAQQARILRQLIPTALQENIEEVVEKAIKQWTGLKLTPEQTSGYSQLILIWAERLLDQKRYGAAVKLLHSLSIVDCDAQWKQALSLLFNEKLFDQWAETVLQLPKDIFDNGLKKHAAEVLSTFLAAPSPARLSHCLKIHTRLETNGSRHWRDVYEAIARINSSSLYSEAIRTAFEMECDQNEDLAVCWTFVFQWLKRTGEADLGWLSTFNLAIQPYFINSSPAIKNNCSEAFFALFHPLPKNTPSKTRVQITGNALSHISILSFTSAKTRALLWQFLETNKECSHKEHLVRFWGLLADLCKAIDDKDGINANAINTLFSSLPKMKTKGGALSPESQPRVVEAIDTLLRAAPARVNYLSCAYLLCEAGLNKQAVSALILGINRYSHTGNQRNNETDQLEDSVSQLILNGDETHLLELVESFKKIEPLLDKRNIRTHRITLATKLLNILVSQNKNSKLNKDELYQTIKANNPKLHKTIDFLLDTLKYIPTDHSLNIDLIGISVETACSFLAERHMQESSDCFDRYINGLEGFLNLRITEKNKKELDLHTNAYFYFIDRLTKITNKSTGRILYSCYKHLRETTFAKTRNFLLHPLIENGKKTKLTDRVVYDLMPNNTDDCEDHLRNAKKLLEDMRQKSCLEKHMTYQAGMLFCQGVFAGKELEINLEALVLRVMAARALQSALPFSFLRMLNIVVTYSELLNVPVGNDKDKEHQERMYVLFLDIAKVFQTFDVNTSNSIGMIDAFVLLVAAVRNQLKDSLLQNANYHYLNTFLLFFEKSKEISIEKTWLLLDIWLDSMSPTMDANLKTPFGEIIKHMDLPLLFPILFRLQQLIHQTNPDKVIWLLPEMPLLWRKFQADEKYRQPLIALIDIMLYDLRTHSKTLALTSLKSAHTYLMRLSLLESLKGKYSVIETREDADAFIDAAIALLLPLVNPKGQLL